MVQFVVHSCEYGPFLYAAYIVVQIVVHAFVYGPLLFVVNIGV